MSGKSNTTRKCKLILEITQGEGTTRYSIKPIVSDLHVRAYQVRKLDGKPEETVYAVTQELTGLKECDCGHRVFRQEVCKHIQCCSAAGLFLATRELVEILRGKPLDPRS